MKRAENDPDNYAEWKKWAVEEDRRSGAELWKGTDESDLYDHEIIRRRYDELVEVRASGDAARLLYYLNEGIHGNMGGMGRPSLYAHAHFGTKNLITSYVRELVRALHDLENVDERQIDLREKIAVLRRARDCFGRSALMFSGAGSLGAFHVGVVKALAEHHLLPNIVSGSSAGSIVAAIVGTRHTEEIPRLFESGSVEGYFALLRGDHTRRTLLNEKGLQAMVDAAVPDMTFSEALEETGRHINISVAPAKLHQRSRLLNASTAPNACIREAVMASCAVPGIFPPVTLAARDANGQRQPYVPSRQWVDGSITDDMPARRLARLYGVNHFISSQANPVILWAAQDPHSKDSLRSRFTGIYLKAAQDWLRAVYPFAMGIVSGVHPVDTYTRLWFNVLTQDYSSDINIVPEQRFFDPRMLLSTLSDKQAQMLVRAGERATWPKIEIIRNCTEVSRCIDELTMRMEEGYTPADVAIA